MAQGNMTKSGYPSTTWASGGVTVVRDQRYCILYVANASLKSDNKTLDVTLPQDFRPGTNTSFYSKCYNGSYVDAILHINTDGSITLTDLFSNAIPNINPVYYQTKPVSYMSAT